MKQEGLIIMKTKGLFIIVFSIIMEICLCSCGGYLQQSEKESLAKSHSLQLISEKEESLLTQSEALSVSQEITSKENSAITQSESTKTPENESQIDIAFEYASSNFCGEIVVKDLQFYF